MTRPLSCSPLNRSSSSGGQGASESTNTTRNGMINLPPDQPTTLAMSILSNAQILKGTFTPEQNNLTTSTAGPVHLHILYCGIAALSHSKLFYLYPPRSFLYVTSAGFGGFIYFYHHGVPKAKAP
ncbi:hypothetical protein RSAG8_02806, partial [Rhizoctonia solani AG-8 WAC10335]